MATYEVVTEDGATYRVETEDGINIPDAPPDTSFSNEINAFGNRLIEGTGGLGDFAEAAERNLNPFRFGGPRAFGLNENIYNRPPETKPSEYVKDATTAIGLYGDEKANTPAGKILGEVGYYAPQMLFPEAIIPSFFGGATAGTVKAAGGGELLQAAGGLVGSLTPAAVSKGYSTVRDIFSSTAKQEQAQQAAKRLIGGISNTDDALMALESAAAKDAATPLVQRAESTYLPQYQRTAERSNDLGLAALEETLRRSDDGVKQAATLQDMLRGGARTEIYNRVNPAPMLDSEAGAVIRSGLEANAKAAGGRVSEFAAEAFQGGEKIATGAAKKAVTEALNSFTKDGSREVTKPFRDLVGRFNALPAEVDLKTLQNYRSAFGNYSSVGKMATTEERITAEIAGKMRSGIESAIESTIDSGGLPVAQGKAWRDMIAARANKGALFEDKGVGAVLEKGAFNRGYDKAAEDVASITMATKEDAKQLVTALAGKEEGLSAARSSLLSKIWERSTNAMTGEINPTSFHRQLLATSEVAPEILTPSSIKALNVIGSDLKSQASIKSGAFAASKGNSVTAEAGSAIARIQEAVGEATSSAARRAIAKTPLVGGWLDSLFDIISDSKQRTLFLNKELAKFVLDPDAAIALLKAPTKETAPLLQRFSSQVSKSLGVPAQTLMGNSEDRAERQKAKQFTSTDPVDIAVEEAIRMKDGEAPLPKPTPMAQLVRAVSLQESSGNPDAIHPMTSRGERAQGLMGILPSTSREIAKELGIDKYDLKDPETNMRFGEHYLKKLLDMFDGNQLLALTAYHSGPGRVKNLLKLHDATTLQEILPHLGPQGRAYASGVMSKLKKIDKYGSVKT